MRSRIPLAIGRGMDRATGMAAVDPSTPVDVRNVIARDGKMSVAPGMALTGLPALGWGTDVVFIIGMESTLDLVVVVYDRVSRQLRLFRYDTINVALQPIESPTDGIWGTLGPGVEFPVICGAEANSRVFLAHAELAIDSRLQTIVYTPDLADPTNVGSFTDLQADLDGDGAADVYFSGVAAHLIYICGWGFGSATDPDRGDILRLSHPLDPTDFQAENFVYVGVQGDPILGALSITGSLSAFGGVQSVLAIGKNSRVFRMVGSSFDDFEIQLLDPSHGFAGAHCAINTGDAAYYWSSDDGPRALAPSGTEPIGQPLELISPLPSDFPSLGPLRNCFAHYDKRRYLVEWYHPDVENAAVPVPGFALSLWDPKNPRWSFRERQQPIICGGYLITRPTGTPPAPPAGYVSAVLAVDYGIASDARYRQVGLSWDNHDAEGTETVQVFAKVSGGSWEIVQSLPVSGASQAVTWPSALPIASYELAIRYVNVHTAGVGYEGSDPDAWTAGTAAGAKGAVVTSSADVAWNAGIEFTDNATPVPLAWTSAQLEAPYLLEKDPGSGWETVASGLTATNYPYTVPVAERGTTVTFRVRAQRAALAGPSAGELDVPMLIIIGTPAWVSAVFSPSAGTIALSWSAASRATSYSLERSADGGATWAVVATQPGTTYSYLVAPSSQFNTTLKFRVTGKNGTFSGTTSAVQDVATTLVIPTATITGISWTDDPAYTAGRLDVTISPAGGNVAYYDAKVYFNGTNKGSIGGSPPRLVGHWSAYGYRGTTLAVTVQPYQQYSWGFVLGTLSDPVSFPVPA